MRATRLNRDALSDLVVLTEDERVPGAIAMAPLSTFNVTNTNNSGNGSLREAIQDANNSGGADVIHFNIGGGGVKTITLSSPLPTINETVTIDGYTQPGSFPRTEVENALLLIELDGSGLGVGSGLRLVPGSVASTVRGIVIRDFPEDGMEVSSSNNIIEGNCIGTNFTGTLDQGNDDGIRVSGGGNRIGGMASGASNVISGNQGRGVLVSSPATTGNRLEGNKIGTDITGVIPWGDAQQGVLIEDSVNNWSRISLQYPPRPTIRRVTARDGRSSP